MFQSCDSTLESVLSGDEAESYPFLSLSAVESSISTRLNPELEYVINALYLLQILYDLTVRIGHFLEEIGQCAHHLTHTIHSHLHAQTFHLPHFAH